MVPWILEIVCDLDFLYSSLGFIVFIRNEQSTNSETMFGARTRHHRCQPHGFRNSTRYIRSFSHPFVIFPCPTIQIPSRVTPNLLPLIADFSSTISPFPLFRFSYFSNKPENYCKHQAFTSFMNLWVSFRQLFAKVKLDTEKLLSLWLIATSWLLFSLLHWIAKLSMWSLARNNLRSLKKLY